MTLAIDVVANAIRSNERSLAAGTLAERYLRALHAADYLVLKRDDPRLSKNDPKTTAPISAEDRVRRVCNIL